MTDDILKQLVYASDTGIFTWLVAKSNKPVGSVAGTARKECYVRICVDRVSYRAHRLAWLFMTGEWPQSEIDHVNGNKADNRWANLRLCSRRQNTANTRRKSSNTTGFKGVAVHPHHPDRYVARIRWNGKMKHLGVFDDKTSAHAAYVEAAKQQFGAFHNAG